MPFWLKLAVTSVAVSLLMLHARRSREFFVLSVRDGRTLLMRGQLPAELRAALNDLVARAHVASGTLCALRDGDRARLIASGLDEPTLQRARNVLGTISMARLGTGRRDPERNLGQRLGIASLAWTLREQRTKRS